MFDISFSELMLIGVIALIVIGPERLPKVARTVGHLLGRAQRYVNEVKSDIQKEVDLKEFSNVKNQIQEAAQSVKSSMTSSMDEFKASVAQPAQDLKDSLEEARKALDVTALGDAPATSEPVEPSDPPTDPGPTGTLAAPGTDSAPGTAAGPTTPPPVSAPDRTGDGHDPAEPPARPDPAPSSAPRPEREPLQES